MRKRQPGQGRLILPYADFIMEVKSYDWRETPDEEVKHRIRRAAERRMADRLRRADPPQNAGAEAESAACAELYSLLSEAVFRCMGLRLFDTQLLAARAMESGIVVQLPTGEGKTLAAAITAAVRALGGEKVHIFVFNDYLAERDRRANDRFYRYCGLTGACIVQGIRRAERRLRYRADVLYITAREAGFDYLKNFLCMEQEECIDLPMACGIVDEADSILIDEARVPLVLAGCPPQQRSEGNGKNREEGAEDREKDGEKAGEQDGEQDGGQKGTAKLAWAAAERMGPAETEVDEIGRRVWLTGRGIALAESLFKIENLYAVENADVHSALMAALEAKYLLKRGRDYLVAEGCVRLVDGLTGRMAESRRYPPKRWQD